ncbi:MAG: YlxR family protein [Deltaproteobacteria bacterium]|nr:YlxR family protein [Deltaproteobacteria bacterium]
MERTCVACRRTGEPDDLVRLVAHEGRAVPDLAGRLPGRGAWVCPTVACVQVLERRGSLLTRALRTPVDSTGLLERVRTASWADLEDALGVAARSGCVRGGAEVLARLGPDSGILALVAARDAAERSVAGASRRLPDVPVHHVPIDRIALGAAVGKGPRAVLAIGRGPASRRLLRILRRGERLG